MRILLKKFGTKQGLSHRSKQAYIPRDKKIWPATTRNKRDRILGSIWLPLVNFNVCHIKYLDTYIEY